MNNKLHKAEQKLREAAADYDDLVREAERRGLPRKTIIRLTSISERLFEEVDRSKDTRRNYTLED